MNHSFFISFFFFFNDTATTEIYTLSDTFPYTTLFRSWKSPKSDVASVLFPDPDSPRTRSEEHTSELQSPLNISYAVFCLKKKKRELCAHPRKAAAAVRTSAQIPAASAARRTAGALRLRRWGLIFFFLMLRRPPRSTR